MSRREMRRPRFDSCCFHPGVRRRDRPQRRTPIDFRLAPISGAKADIAEKCQKRDIARRRTIYGTCWERRRTISSLHRVEP